MEAIPVCYTEERRERREERLVDSTIMEEQPFHLTLLFPLLPPPSSLFTTHLGGVFAGWRNDNDDLAVDTAAARYTAGTAAARWIAVR